MSLLVNHKREPLSIKKEKFGSAELQDYSLGD